MSFDAWVVGFGISVLLRELQLVGSHMAYLVLAAVAVLDAGLLYRFFAGTSEHQHGCPSPPSEPDK